ncbi:hypothetical protein GCM10018987_16270 [Streptomyces cremeus]
MVAARGRGLQGGGAAADRSGDHRSRGAAPAGEPGLEAAVAGEFGIGCDGGGGGGQPGGGERESGDDEGEGPGGTSASGEAVSAGTIHNCLRCGGRWRVRGPPNLVQTNRVVKVLGAIGEGAPAAG